MREIGSALSHKTLDESNAPEVLIERISSILFYEPSIWLKGDDLPHDRYWRLIGYDNIQEIEQVKISDLIKRVDELIKRFNPRIEERDNLYRSYLHRTNQLLAVYFALSQLDQDGYLGHLPYAIDRLWNYRRINIDTFLEEVKQLIPCVISKL